MPEVFNPLWRARRKFILNSQVCQKAYERYKQRLPDKINALTEILCSRSGLSREQLLQERHFFQAFAFTEMVEAYRPDYIHSYFFYEGSLFALVASFLLDIPRGVSCYSDHMLKDYVLKVVPLHLEQCSLVIATSEQIKAELLKINPLAKSEKIIVKSNAIQADHFPFRERAEPENGQPFRLITVSRIDPKKGLVYLLQAIRYLRDENLNVQAHIIGGIDNHRNSRQYAIEVENTIKQLDLSDVVHLEGTRTQKEVQRFLAEGHLFVAPFIETESGDKDGIPTSLMEAMASGMPVIATDAGSIPEVVKNGINGQIVQQKNHRALGNALKELLLEPEKRRSFGSRASQTIRSQFDVRNSEKIFHDRLEKLLEGKRKTNGF